MLGGWDHHTQLGDAGLEGSALAQHHWKKHRKKWREEWKGLELGSLTKRGHHFLQVPATPR